MGVLHSDNPWGAGAAELRVRRIRGGAVMPAYHSEHAAGMDLAACPPDGRAIEIPAGEIRMVPTGLVVAVPLGYEAQVRPRSGLATRHAVTVPNAPGTIDADYRGEVVVALINLGRVSFVVEPGMRVAQMVVAPVARVRVREVEGEEALGETVRGTGGFGSTGL